MRGLAAGSSSREDDSQARHDERWQVPHRIRTAYAPHTLPHAEGAAACAAAYVYADVCWQVVYALREAMARTLDV